MKCDRRILSVLAAIILGLAINQQFRSLFLFGARASTNQLTMNGMKLVSTQDETNPINLGVWSLPALPAYKETTRDQLLGGILCRTNRDWNHISAEGGEAVHLIEDYCKAHPSDLAARAHLVRLSLNAPSLKLVRDKKLMTDQAIRMAKYAADSAVIEPRNWFWRERQVHFLMLIGDMEKAEEVFTAQPFPTMFEDYVDDEVRAKEAFYAGGYFDLPRSAMMALWAETIYPHFSTINQTDELIKKSHSPAQVRIADIQFGRALIRSCPSTIAVLVGMRQIRRGLWDSLKMSGDPKKLARLNKEAEIAPEFLKVDTKANWDQTLQIARQNLYLGILPRDSDLTLLYVGQLGPIFIAAGIYTAIFSLVLFGLSQRKVRNIDHPFAGWFILLVAMTAPNFFWSSAEYLMSYSLGNSFLIPVYIGLIGACLWALRKQDDIEKKVYLLLPLGLAAGLGFLSPGLQATMTFFLVAFALQRGKMPLSPWMAGAGMLVLSYHCLINLAFARSGLPVAIGFIPAVVGILVVSHRKLEPDQPRLAPMAIALGAAIIGTFLVAQYDRGVATYFESEQKIRTELKAKLESLQFS